MNCRGQTLQIQTGLKQVRADQTADVFLPPAQKQKDPLYAQINKGKK